MTVKIVTDSTSDLPPEVAQRLGIEVVPLNVHFGTETLLDGVDIAPAEFYQRLQNSPRLPTTSQPSVGAFIQVYQRLGTEADGIISLHVSSKISGTYNSATQAKEEAGIDCPIEVIDTLQASMGLGLVCTAVAKAVQEGAGLEEAKGIAQSVTPRCHFFGLLDTLEYLQKGGRIGKAQAFLGSLLRIKPLLTIRDGEAHPLERARTRDRGIAKMCEIAESLAPLEEACALYSTTPEEAEAIAQRLGHLVPDGRVIVASFGPVVGTYLGPGALGVALRSAG